MEKGYEGGKSKFHDLHLSKHCLHSKAPAVVVAAWPLKSALDLCSLS